jgi:hypothetical protein
MIAEKALELLGNGMAIRSLAFRRMLMATKRSSSCNGQDDCSPQHLQEPIGGNPCWSPAKN